MTKRNPGPYPEWMRNLTAFTLGLFLSSCASQKASVPHERHLTHLPESFSRPASQEEEARLRAIEIRSQRAHASHGQAEHCRSKDSAPHRFEFGAADVNKDRKVSRAEFNCEALAWFGHADPDKNHRLHVARHAHKDHHAELSALDHAGKGELNVMQFLHAMDLRFARADRNNDGRLDAKEFASASLSALPAASKGAR